MVCTCVNELKRLQSGGCCTTLMTYSFVTQPASSTSCAHYARRLTYRRPRVTVGCAAGSQTTCERFFLLPGRHPHSGKTREQKSGRQTLAENPFPHAGYIGYIFLNALCYSHDVQQRTVVQRCPLRLRPRRAVSRRRRMEKRRQRRMGRGRAHLL
jgi:hypothetical protein